jgi:O-antigen/teichoic acid export membrane protein
MRATNRVAVNTVIQYSRLVINALISLVSVRLILGALGEDDYGLYDVIAGVIGLIGFISSSLSMTSTRFLSISLGKNDEEGTRKAFNSCFWMHLLMAAGLVLVLELLSFYIFDGYLKILPDRLQTAKWIYQCMLVSLFLSISVTPFISMLVSHENFVYVSLVYIVDAVCKLGIAIIITKYGHDRLLLYGILMMLITFLNVLCFVVYCVIRYRRLLRVRVVALRELGGVSGFAGWTMLDALGATLSRQGYAVLLNRFFGTTVNAVFALARQVEAPIYTIAVSIIDSMKPQIMKSYGAGDERKMMRLSLIAGKLGFSMMSLLAIPVLIMMPEVLDLWLKEYPEGTVLFSRLLLIACMANQLTMGLFYANQAIGDIKWFSIVVSTLRMLSLPISWCFLKLGYPAYVAIVVFVVCETLGSFSRVVILSKLSKEMDVMFFLKSVFLKVLPPFVLAMAICWSLYHCFNTLWGLLLTSIVTIVVYSMTTFFFGMSKEEQKAIKGVFHSFLGKLKLNYN